MVRGLLELFMKKNFKKQTKTEFNVKGKVIKKKKQTVCQMERLW